MTNSARRKKAKKADFAKVKIKVGKKLKKAQNETKVDFKVRKLIIKEQLASKDATGQLITKKKHTIKELLSRLGHQSTCVRQDGIDGLKELLREHDSSILSPHLSSLVPRLAFCTLDLDTKIRTSSVKIIEIMIIKMKDEVRTYYEVIVTHLACAMVHMNIGVQADSLRLMNVLITHTPNLICHHADSLLKNFINLISRKVSNEQNKIVDYTRSLLVSPTNVLTSLKWRNQLWQELSRYLQTIIKEMSRSVLHAPHSLWEVVLQSCDVSEECRTSHVNQIGLLNNVEQFHLFTSSIIPLLAQTWAEVDPRRNQKRHDSADNGLEEEEMQTLKCVTTLLKLIHQISLHRNLDQPEKFSHFKHTLQMHFYTELIAGFPYYQIEKSGKSNKKNKKQDLDNDISICHDLNIAVISLCLLFHENIDDQLQYSRILNFMKGLYVVEANDGRFSMNTLVEVTITFLPVAEAHNTKYVDIILSAAFQCFKRIHSLRKDRHTLLLILLEITDIRFKSCWKFSTIRDWIEYLIHTLSNDKFGADIMNDVQILRLRNSANICQLWNKNQHLILENLKERPAIQV